MRIKSIALFTSILISFHHSLTVIKPLDPEDVATFKEHLRECHLPTSSTMISTPHVSEIKKDADTVLIAQLLSVGMRALTNPTPYYFTFQTDIDIKVLNSTLKNNLNAGHIAWYTIDKKYMNTKHAVQKKVVTAWLKAKL